MSKAPDIDAWWNQLERLERVLMCVGPDEVCCECMTPRQTSILRTLIAQEGARFTDLAAASRITPSAMTRVIEKLEKQGMVERVRGQQDDVRAAMVRITAAGRKARRRIDQLMRDRARAVASCQTETDGRQTESRSRDRSVAGGRFCR